MRNLSDYAAILDAPRHVSIKHPPMPREQRAAQFMPFAALVGFEDAVKETAQEVLKRSEAEEPLEEFGV